MLKKGFIKPKISIDNLGKKTFWTGIIIGIAVSLILSYFFNYSRESLRMLTFTSELYILPEKEFLIYDLFFSAFATSLGFGFVIIYWLGNRAKKVKRSYFKTFAISNSYMISIVTLMSVARFGSILPIILYSIRGYDNNLDMVQDFWILIVLLPIYVFNMHWNSIRLIFQTQYWVSISILLYFLVTFCLFKTTHAERSILNQNYYLHNKERFDYINSEFQNARKLGVFFNDTTKQILQKRHAERSTNLVIKLKKTFNTDHVVPLDTLILEKIVIHIMNRYQLHFNGYYREVDANWPYALPEQLYYQIQKHEINSAETKVLFEILYNQVSIFTAKDLSWDEYNRYSSYEKEKSSFNRHLVNSTETIQSRLVQVIDQLKLDKRYEKYYYLLPDMEFDIYTGRQKYYKLKLTPTN